MNRFLNLLSTGARLASSSLPFSMESNEAVAAARAAIEREFHWLQSQQPRLLRLALNEAEALAWQTGYGPLLFPLLALEKVRLLAAWHERQVALRKRPTLLAFAA